MQKYLFILFLLRATATFAQNDPDTLILTADKIGGSPYYLNTGWKYFAGDDSAMASSSFDDSRWITAKTSLLLDDSMTPAFHGIAWFRLHFTTDSSLLSRPLALSITHFGASEIYLDGKRIRSNGKINGPDQSEYYDSGDMPFVMTVVNPGRHLLSVRYANYPAQKNYSTYLHPFAGFRMYIGPANELISYSDRRSIIISFTLALICGIFLALSLIHLLMYLYYKSARSNLFFSIFIFCIGGIFLIGFISFASTSPPFHLSSIYLLTPALVFACIALSGFITELFAKNKLRFRVIAIFGGLTLLIRVLGLKFAPSVTVALIISVSFEAVFTVIFAMVKRVKGAHIIGTGILFFTLFVLTMMAMALTSGGNFDINDSTIGGQIFIIFLGLAIISIPASMSVYLAWNFSAVNKNLAGQLEQVKALSQKTIEQELEKQQLLESKKEELEKEVTQRTSELREEKKKSDDLLLNILPSEIAEELKEKGRSSAKTYSLVTVMFTDFKDFTGVSEKISAELLVAEIDYCFSAFDRIIQKYRIEKIKTIGDAYICASGLPVSNFTHAADMISAALEIRDFMIQRCREKELKGEIPFRIRIGIHTGPVVAGIVGIKKFAYDIWGDAVNIAARMESSGEEDKVNISGATYELVKEQFTCIHRGKIEAKNKGEVDMYFVESEK